jgi:TonB family protein
MVLAAPPDERLFEAPKPRIWADKRRFFFVLAFCFVLHALAILFLNSFGVAGGPAPEPEEIPIEVINEPPPPEPAAPQPESKPESKPEPEQKAEEKILDEKPATDAPREKNDEKVERDAHDDTSHSPKTPSKSETVEVKPPSEMARTEEKPLDAKAPDESAPKVKQDRPDGEPVPTADLEGERRMKALEAALHPQPQQTPAPNPLAAFVATPDFSFAPASKYAPVAGGKAATTYLTTLYGMMSSHMHLSAAAGGRAHTAGEITFSIDFSGRLTRAHVSKSSGLAELDAAALAAVRASAPFPPPPTGSGLSLRLVFNGD